VTKFWSWLDESLVNWALHSLTCDFIFSSLAWSISFTAFIHSSNCPLLRFSAIAPASFLVTKFWSVSDILSCSCLKFCSVVLWLDKDPTWDTNRSSKWLIFWVSCARHDSTNTSVFFFDMHCACFIADCFNKSLIDDKSKLITSLTCLLISFMSCWRLSLTFTNTSFSTFSRISFLRFDSIFVAALVTIWEMVLM